LKYVKINLNNIKSKNKMAVLEEEEEAGRS
jgi:hypothetical protein